MAEQLFQSGALHRAIRKDDMGKVCELLLDGNDPNDLDAAGNTPSHVAAQYGSKEALLMLFNSGANFDLVNHEGKTPLMVADYHAPGNFTVVDLLELGANPDVQDFNGQTVLHQCAGAGDFELAQILIDHGADISALDENHQTPLDVSISNDSDEVASLLMNRMNQVQERSSHVIA